MPWLRWAAWLLLGFFGVFPGIVAYMVWLERRWPPGSRTGSAPTAWARWGSCSRSPTRSKLLTKEDIVPRSADQVVHLIAPVLVIVSAFLVMAVIPFAINLGR